MIPIFCVEGGESAVTLFFRYTTLDIEDSVQSYWGIPDRFNRKRVFPWIVGDQGPPQRMVSRNIGNGM
jgi:hypothetical protein